MLYSYLRPVGYPVSLIGSKEPPLANRFSPYSPIFYHSGTESLASAVNIAKQLVKTDTPEMIVSAYACPDVISAILYNDVTPILVDYEKDRPWLDLNTVKSAINENTIGIIAINFLGIPERSAELKALLEDTQGLLIEDLAQWFPEPDASAIQGDLAITSFGRGKPVSVLGGGALLVKNEEHKELAIKTEPTEKASFPSIIKHSLKSCIYNTLISPLWYWLPNKLPFLKLGETHFDPLETVESMPEEALRLLNRNQKKYFSRKKIQPQISNILHNTLHDFIDLPKETGYLEERRLLRYPILLPSEEEKSRLLEQLKPLGVSPLYPKPLFEFEAIEPQVKRADEGLNASSFCDRLLTFPVYQDYPQKKLAQALAQRN